MLEQIFRNSNEGERWSTKYLCMGLGILFAYDFFMYAEALLFRNLDTNLWQARGIVIAMSAIFVGIGIGRIDRSDDSQRLYVSRHVAFHSVTLLAAGPLNISNVPVPVSTITEPVVVDKIPKPFFAMVPVGERLTSEDEYFCKEAKVNGITSYLHTEVKAHHIDTKTDMTVRLKENEWKNVMSGVMELPMPWPVSNSLINKLKLQLSR